MKVTIGSQNQTKVNAVQNVFNDYVVNAIHASSRVSSQPSSDEETMKGAINRALASFHSNPDGIGIGLEGGVMYIDDQLFLCNWGALVSRDDNIYTASGARILLPKEIEDKLKSGMELGDIMDDYTHQHGVRHNEGAIGIFTNLLVSRKDMFEHVVTLLRGQWEYWEK